MEILILEELEVLVEGDLIKLEQEVQQLNQHKILMFHLLII